MTVEMRLRGDLWASLVLAWAVLWLMTASLAQASMVGMVVGRSGNVIVEKKVGGSFSVDGFVRVDVGDKVVTKDEGGQLLLFDNTRAQLLPGAKYRVGRSGVFKRLSRGCVLAHQYRRHFPAAGEALTPHESSPIVGTLRLGKAVFVLRSGKQWIEARGEFNVHINDIIHVREGGGVRLELAKGGIVHFTGPAQGYLNGRGLELEVGKVLVNSTSAPVGLTVGTPTAEVAETRSLFGIAVAAGLTKVRSYGGKLNLANRYGRKKSNLRLTGLCQGAVDGNGNVTKSNQLVFGEVGREVVATILKAINDGETKNYHERIARATAALGKAMSKGRTEMELAKLNPVGQENETPEDEYEEEEQEDDWKSEVSNYFDNFQASNSQPVYDQPVSSEPVAPQTNVQPPQRYSERTPVVRPTTSNVRPTTQVKPNNTQITNVRSVDAAGNSGARSSNATGASNRVTYMDFEFR